MYKVMLVDDEPHVLSTIEKLIPWDEFGISICAAAANGKEALRLMDKYSPDIVITDISMPEMNGLELIRQASAKHKFRFIVLSGYDDFDYVRTSMKLGALNYIMKPTTAEELTETITECLEILDAGQNDALQTQTTEILRTNLLTRLVTGSVSLKELKEKSSVLGRDLRGKTLLPGIFMTTNNLSAETLRRITEVIHSTLLSKNSGYSFIDHKGNISVILAFDGELPALPEIYAQFDECVDKIIETAEPDIVAFVGPPAATTNELPHSYNMALSLIDFAFLLPSCKTIHPDITVEKQSAITRTANFMTVFSYLKNKDAAALCGYIDDLVSPDKQVSDPIQAKYSTVEIASILFSAAAALEIPSSIIDDFHKQFFFTYKNDISIDNFLESLHTLVEKIIGARDDSQPNYSSKIQTAVEIVRSRYSDPNLSLKTLAYELGINSAYLGRQFKLETGQYFSDYLNSCRVAQAKHLFETTELPATEISVMVGYTTTNYFYGIFKKVTGISTSSYRQVFHSQKSEESCPL